MRDAKANSEAAPSLLWKIQKTLWEEWDPIGVNDGDDYGEDAPGQCPTGEYDSYAPQLLRMLLLGADHTEISAHLEGIVQGYMGLSGNQDVSDHAAKALLDLKNN